MGLGRRKKDPDYFERLTELRPFPASAVRLIEAVNDDCVEISELSQLVGNDPAIVAEVLKSANSALKSQVQKVESLDGAVMSLGIRGIAEIAITVLCGRHLLEAVPLPKIANSIWRHSLAVGAIADSLARAENANSGIARTVGLLHEVGRLVAIRVAPERMELVQEAIGADTPLAEAESQILECTGEQLTVRVARVLEIPELIVTLLESLVTEADDMTPEAAAVSSAGSLAPILGYPPYPGSLGPIEDAGARKVLDSEQVTIRNLSRVAEEAIQRATPGEATGVDILTVSPDRAFDALLIANRRLARLNSEYERTRQELELRARETQSLADTLAAITMGLDQASLRYSILESLLENYRVDASFLVTCEEGQGIHEGVIFRIEAEGTPDFSPLTLDMSRFTRETRQAIMCGMSVTLSESSDDPYFFESIGKFRRLRIAPLMVRGNCSGIMGIGVRDGNLSSRSRGDFLEIVAGAAALGLENARLFQNALEEATQDVLTGLLTRRRILEELENVTQSNTGSLAVCLVDLDNFKSVNDTLGHQQGDRYLRTLARGMSSVIPESAHMGRYGGDEFLVVIPDITCDEAAKVAEAIRAKAEHLASGERWAAVDAALSVTLGLTWWEGPDAPVTELVGRADTALYEAKKAGRNRVRVSGEAWVPAG